MHHMLAHNFIYSANNQSDKLMEVTFELTMKIITMVALVLTSSVFDTSLANICVLRTAEFEDVVYNSTNGTTCTTDIENVTDLLKCPEESPTFLMEDNCCTQDQIHLNECDLRLESDKVSTSPSRFPVAFIQNVTRVLKTTIGNMSEEAVIRVKNDSHNTVRCNLENITLVSGSRESLSEEDITIVDDFKLQVLRMDRNNNGVYKLELSCNTSNGTEKECLFFKFVNSQDEIRMKSIRNGVNASAIEVCPTSIDLHTTTIATEHSFPTTYNSTPTSTTTDSETISIWLQYNKLLIYVVVGGGCGLGLLLVFIIMLCVLTGCVASRRRNRVRRKRQLETAPSLQRPSNPERADIQYRQNVSYSLQMNPEDTTDINATEGIIPGLERPEPQVTLQLVKVEIPVVPQQQTKSDDLTMSDTFKRPPKGLKLREPIPQQEIPTTSVSTSPLPYYETVIPLQQLDTTVPQGEPTETYDTLIHQGVASSQPEGRHFTLPNLHSEYSQLDMRQSNTTRSPLTTSDRCEPDHSYSLVTPRSQRKCSSPLPLPPPISPYADAVELLGPQNKYLNDILTSSWSKPSMVDKVRHEGLHAVEEDQVLYDQPSSLDLVPARPMKQSGGGGLPFKIDEDRVEVIYDVPRKISREETTSSLDSYVDMQSHSIY